MQKKPDYGSLFFTENIEIGLVWVIYTVLIFFSELKLLANALYKINLSVIFGPLIILDSFLVLLYL